ncbi:THO complex subunit 7-like protein [Armadillidium nasatum]|uniref:THO complex subunit 7-like protein n=1 Tax=Armadillidium nasatum TaxID=96803 RepID=A0A5N5TMB1_9CRUS|nr:THO complex subunit 7-like protein [Armadillidium nasatum]
MTDDDIIKRRLLIDGDGTGEARIMTKFMKSFIKWSSSDDSAIESHIQYDRLLTQLSNIESSSVKWSNVIRMNEEELNNYDELRDNTNNGVEGAVKAITTTKEELKGAREVRSNRMEYDALARLIKEHPPRSDTANKLKLLNQELNSLKSKRDQLEHRLSLRRKQLHVLVTALHQLQQTLNDISAIDSVDHHDISPKAVIDLTSDVPMEVI